MTRNLISEAANIKAFTPAGIFATADTMTVTVYKDGSSTAEALTAGTVSQISTLGIFFWPFSDLVNAPTALSQYTVLFKDATTKVHSEIFEFGGWTELLLSLPANLQAADTCIITTNLYEINGTEKTDPDTLGDVNKSNHIELKTKWFANNRYFELGKYKPSYSASSGGASWELPQGATVDIKLDTFGINETGKEVPAQSTITLDAWLAL